MILVNEQAERTSIAARVGGHIALEFANTAGWHLATQPAERLLSWPDVIKWASELQIVSPEQAAALSGSAGDLQGIVRLREDVFDVGRALAQRSKPDITTVERIAASAGGTSPQPLLAGATMRWHFDPATADEQLATLLSREALSLFCSARAERITVCQGGECGWLFLDESRSGRRRWCSMDDCGSRAKARRHYQRARTARAA